MNSLSRESSTQYNTLTVIGEGQVSAIPDTAVVRLGVLTTGDELSQVQQENARISQNVLNTLNDYGITDVKTVSYNIEKLYEYQNGIQIDRGYSVRNIFEIRIDDISQVGEIIDAAVSSGANVVEFVTFEVSNADAFYLQALNLAVSDAFQKADSILNHIGTMINPIPKKITENSTSPIPFSQIRLERSFTTPIEPGISKIEASVTIEFLW